MSTAILSLRDLTVDFGGVRAVNQVTLDIQPGELVGLIGPNGAGKTTVFNLITNSIQATSGDILFQGKSIRNKMPDAICRMGISRTFQNIRLFPQMSVYENVELALHNAPRYSILEAFVRTPRASRIEKETRQRAFELLEMVSLKDYVHEKAANLPYGLQRRLEMARAMAANPSLLLLDEPAAGMNEDECNDLIKLIRQIHTQMGYAIIMIEHHMNVVMDLCAGSRIYVLNLGSILAVGSPAEIQSNPDVIKAYLGERRNVR
ncbi:ABC transporter ATP-binding protein [Levilinea saccharolytica]|uniref:Leucine/isoleucine/valine transporter ATP-binding subunit n=1 Tax=Levilinea saccharolytica TaxID=229921 RepID=A0A0P6Y1Y5_9CHLR|nr:ABC transporter ATP-binding protein [Levilinea saccharolytica]KPL75641.1 leucine/isoleucine/valine transporter ATP-binding subunit [Levilinea saccharolytica]GAP16565.1 amino acid/amide ABC transporter ATP-binding protein 1, HAAT family [Levilinea saccharolytica]